MQTPGNIDPWIQATSANLNISTADRLKASNLLHEFQRLDWWSDYSDDGDVRYREMIRTGNALDQLTAFAGASNDHAYLASRIYDKTAPEEFMRSSYTWYVPDLAQTQGAFARPSITLRQDAPQPRAAAMTRLAERDARLEIKHSRWTGEPLGSPALSNGQGQKP